MVHGLMEMCRHFKSKLAASPRKLKVNYCIFQQDNDQKHMFKSTRKGLNDHRDQASAMAISAP